jgi:hypothetical protein
MLNGVKIASPGPLSAAPPYQKQPVVDDINLMNFWPEPGKYTLRLNAVGRNPLSGGTSIRRNSVRLRERRPRVKEAAYLQGLRLRQGRAD